MTIIFRNKHYQWAFVCQETLKVSLMENTDYDQKNVDLLCVTKIRILQFLFISILQFHIFSCHKPFLALIMIIKAFTNTKILEYFTVSVYKP